MRQNSDETSSNLGSSQRLCQGYKDARYSTTDANVGHCYERPVNKGCINMVNVRDNAFSALSFIIDSFSLSYLLTFILFYFIFFLPYRSCRWLVPAPGNWIGYYRRMLQDSWPHFFNESTNTSIISQV